MVDVLPKTSQVYFGVASHLSLTVVGRGYHSQLDVNFRSHSVNPKKMNLWLGLRFGTHFAVSGSVITM